MKSKLSVRKIAKSWKIKIGILKLNSIVPNYMSSCIIVSSFAKCNFRFDLLEAIVRSESEKIIVTHGTDTIIETGNWLETQLKLHLKSKKRKILQ